MTDFRPSDTRKTDYIVFARKYRPHMLKDVVGQEILVTALQKAMDNNQLPHAILLQGIRGVGKTTTARIIAKGLNCEKGQTVDPCGTCASCEAIQNDRHLDVIEMDAASHTGVDDIREITETAKYKAVQGRFKVYIIDEVHMLSKSAFNALLKTLEEPPPFVKFIFATTEIQKVPETILSRCMRFDLKRMSIKTIIERIEYIAKCENLPIEKEASLFIARAAEGSMRDALSLLDQAFVLCKESRIKTDTVRSMLGLSCRNRMYDILSAVCAGDVVRILTLTDDFFNDGGDATLFLKDVLDALYGMVCLKTNDAFIERGEWTEAEKAMLKNLLPKITMPSLMQMWQILNDRYDRVHRAPSPSQALQVLLLQVCYITQLPSLHEILSNSEVSYPQEGCMPATHNPVGERQASQIRIRENTRNMTLTELPSSLTPSLPKIPSSFEELVAFVKEKREPILYTHMRNDVSVQSYEQGCIGLHTKPGAPKDLIHRLKSFLERNTGQSWIVEDKGISPTALSLKDLEEQAFYKKTEDTLSHPLVRDLLDTFPGATVVVNDEGTS